jgi:hypothetical protein
MTDSTPHSRVWFSPHGTEWEAETYEEALEMERDSLVEQLEAERAENARFRSQNREFKVTVDALLAALARAEESSPAKKP